MVPLALARRAHLSWYSAQPLRTRFFAVCLHMLLCITLGTLFGPPIFLAAYTFFSWNLIPPFSSPPSGWRDYTYRYRWQDGHLHLMRCPRTPQEPPLGK